MGYGFRSKFFYTPHQVWALLNYRQISFFKITIPKHTPELDFQNIPSLSTMSHPGYGFRSNPNGSLPMYLFNTITSLKHIPIFSNLSLYPFTQNLTNF